MHFLSHVLSLHVSHLSRSSLDSGQRQLQRSYIFLKRVKQHSSKTDHSPPRMSCPQLGSPKFVRQPFHQRLCKFRCDLRGHCYAQRFLVGCDLSQPCLRLDLSVPFTGAGDSSAAKCNFCQLMVWLALHKLKSVLVNWLRFIGSCSCPLVLDH